MSVPVELPALRLRLAEYGEQAFLITVGEAPAPHVVSVVVRLVGDQLVMGAGRKTRANGAARRAVSLMWPAVGDGPYCLIVDGTFVGESADGGIAVTPNSAILHRVAGAPGDGPNCVPVAEA